MRTSIEVPVRVFELMLSETIHGAVRMADGTDAAGPPMNHPGDLFGRVAAWLWQTGEHGLLQQAVVEYTANILGPGRGLDDILWGLGSAITVTLDDAEAARFEGWARGVIEDYYRNTGPA